MTTTPPGRLPLGGIALFLCLTFAISWGAWGAAYLAGGDIADPAVLAWFFLGGCGPTLAAAILRATGRRSPRSALPGLAVGWGLVSVAVGALPAVAAAYLTPLLGAEAVGSTEVAAAVAMAGGPLVFTLMTFFTGPLSEEFGWRGYLQPRLRRRLSPLATSVTLGAVWGPWHLPLYFLDGTWQSSVGITSLQAVIVVLSAIPLSAGAWFVSERLRGGVPAAVLVHAAANGAMALFPPVSMEAGVVYVVVLVAIAAVVLVAGRQRRRP
jgi:membrane protease YdiL (CAAX protease family)